MKRFLCLTLCAAVLLSLVQPQAKAAPSGNPVLRIGLVGSKSMIAANLSNLVGSGYEFGYLNANREFVSVGYTAETKITMIKNRNVYLSGGTYSDTASDVAVGAFHDRYGSFASREEAEAAVLSLREQGIAAFVSYRSGEFLVRAGSYTDSGGGTRDSGSVYCVSVVITGTNNILFQFDGGETSWLCVRPVSPDGAKPITWHNTYRYYGMLEFRRYDGNNINVYNVVDMQDYLKGVIPYEMNPAWPVEALKAQAVSAKSYALSNSNRHKSEGFDLCNDEHCQVYKGTGQASEVSNRAVDETYGQVLTYHGTACNTVYHASDGGATEDSENVWVTAVPYLRGVPDPYEDASKIPGYQWQYTVTNAQISAYLNQRGIANSGVSNFYVERYTGMGNVYSLVITDNNGKKLATYEKESVRSLIINLTGSKTSLSIRYTVGSGDAMLAVISKGNTVSVRTDISTLYTIDGNGNIVPLPPAGSVSIISAGGGLYGLPVQSNNNTGVYTIAGRGNGHNVGMSQWGAHGMAEKGFTYDQILTHYFTGAELTYMG